MPQGFSTFSFNLFGFSNRHELEGSYEATNDQRDAVEVTRDNSEQPDRSSTDAEEVAFWGLGLFPVL
jgi:hypothetical protein